MPFHVISFCLLNSKQIHLNVSLVKQACTGEHRILALVECRSTYALFVIISEKPKPASFSDLTIERAIPVDQHFSCGVFLACYKKSSVFSFFCFRYWFVTYRPEPYYF